MSLLHSSTRRPAALIDTDYDHIIKLIDHTRPESPEATRSRSASDRPSSPGLLESPSPVHSGAPLRKKQTPLHLRQEVAKRKYAKYQDRRLEGWSDNGQPEQDAIEGDSNEQVEAGEEDRGRPRTSGSPRRTKTKTPKEPESAIDILYENERGGFLCGMPLFSSRALGNLDPSPWTNIAQKTSATNITNAQVPDPSWEWAWKEWHINHTDEVDEEGWEYSFMFSKKYSWHKKTWWNSFVRRRAWTRKRVKKDTGYIPHRGHMLNPDYFTIHPRDLRSTSRGSTAHSRTNRNSTLSTSRRGTEEDAVPEEICDIGALLKALRFARIDREKTEAVESFIANGGDDLYYLQVHMHEIMAQFIFQASRRLLLSHLIKIFDEASKEDENSEKEVDPSKRKRLENLEAAVKHADEEVRKLEFWSDVKDMAERGETVGAMDKSQGWDTSWAGLDASGPKDVISDQNLPGSDNCTDGEGNGTAIEPSSTNGSTEGKGKGKE